MGIICAAVLSFIWSTQLEVPDPSVIPHYHLAVLLFALASVIELLAEPLWVLGQALLFVKLQVCSQFILPVYFLFLYYLLSVIKLIDTSVVLCNNLSIKHETFVNLSHCSDYNQGCPTKTAPPNIS